MPKEKEEKKTLRLPDPIPLIFPPIDFMKEKKNETKQSEDALELSYNGSSAPWSLNRSKLTQVVTLAPTLVRLRANGKLEK